MMKLKHVHRRSVSILLIAMLCTSPAGAAESPRAEDAAPRPTVIQPALDGIFAAFASHPLVGLGEVHGVTQLLDFYRDIVRDSRFARDVGHVVVEFGGAAHQEVIDRYVDGQPVSYMELRKVWTETVGWQPTVFSEGYAMFFAQVRQTNLALPPGRRIKVWLGEPPIDWARIRTAADYRPILATRDSHVADLITRRILSQGHKALVIYGGAHFDRTQPWENEARAALAAADPGGPMSQAADATLRDLIEQRYPDSLFVIQPYRGFADDPCTQQFEERMRQWPMPALGVAVAGTTLEQDMRHCLAPRALLRAFPPTIPADVQERVRALVSANADRDRPLLADSILFYAPSAQLTRATPFLEFFLDEAWRTELSRRNEIITGRPLPADWGRLLSSQTQPYTQRD